VEGTSAPLRVGLLYGFRFRCAFRENICSFCRVVDVNRTPPLGLAISALYFGIPSAIFTCSLFWLLPWLIANGTQPLAAFTISLSIPNMLLLLASIVGFRVEGNSWNWTSFRNRMRLGAPDARTWVWTVALCLGAPFLGSAVEQLRAWLPELHLYDRPQAFVAFMRHDVTSVYDHGGQFLGMSLEAPLVDHFILRCRLHGP